MTNKTTEFPLAIPLTVRPDDRTILTYAKNVYYEKLPSGRLKAYKRPAFTWRPFTNLGGTNEFKRTWITDDPENAFFMFHDPTPQRTNVGIITYVPGTPAIYVDAGITYGHGTIFSDDSPYGLVSVYKDASGEEWYLIAPIQKAPFVQPLAWGTSGTALTLVSVIFPGMGKGLVSFDGYAFAADRQYVYHNDAGDITAWTSTNVITPRLGTDILYIEKHKNHVTVFSNKGIEFFRNTRNTGSGSVLGPRYGNESGIVLNAVSNRFVVARDAVNDVIYFVGIDSSGKPGVYKIQDFIVSKISTSDIETLLGHTTDTGYEVQDVRLHHFTIRSKSHLMLVIHAASGTTRIVFDEELGIPSVWDIDPTVVDGIEDMQPVNIRIYNATSRATIWFADGDDAGGGYLLDYEATQDLNSSSVSKDIDVEFVYPNFMGDGTDDTTAHKYGNFLKIDADGQSSSQSATISWSDDDYSTYTSGRTLTLGRDALLPQLGSWRERSFKVAITDNQAIGISGIYLNYQIGDE